MIATADIKIQKTEEEQILRQFDSYEQHHTGFLN